MKKILFAIAMLLAVGLFATDTYCYKMGDNGKIGVLKVVNTDAEATALQGKGFTVTTDKMAVYKVFLATGQSDSPVFKSKVSITEQDLIQLETVFSKLEIRETFDSIIVIPATADVPAVTLGNLLTQVLAGNAKFATYWADADKGIDIAYPVVVEALAQFPVPLDIPALKLAILANRQKRGK